MPGVNDLTARAMNISHTIFAIYDLDGVSLSLSLSSTRCVMFTLDINEGKIQRCKRGSLSKEYEFWKIKRETMTNVNSMSLWLIFARTLIHALWCFIWRVFCLSIFLFLFGSLVRLFYLFIFLRNVFSINWNLYIIL